jgi:Fur family zinc uptake transcriptional regulator
MTVAEIAIHQRNQKSNETAQAIAQAEAICRSYGARLTPIRRRVLETLHASAKPLGAYELADALAPNGRRMAPITIYRALEFLIEQGLAHRLASQNAYIASFNGSGSRGATAFLLCEECGGVDEVTSAELGETLSNLLNRQGFQPRARVMEVTGRCSHCQGVH